MVEKRCVSDPHQLQLERHPLAEIGSADLDGDCLAFEKAGPLLEVCAAELTINDAVSFGIDLMLAGQYWLISSDGGSAHGGLFKSFPGAALLDSHCALRRSMESTCRSTAICHR
ncbi:MAG: hypothetical protein ACNYNX_08330 [Leucobacter sp.]